MDGFSYTNIFETKGIEYLVVIGFLLLIVPFWILLNRPLKVKEKIKSLGVLMLSILRIPQGIFYSKNHTWTYLESSGNARIGLDDLLLHITGAVEVTNIRNSGEKVNRGDIIAHISHDGKQLEIASPLTGEVLSVNALLKEVPETLNRDPFEKGWICKLKPEKWLEETRSFYFADAAVEWTKRELDRFKDFISVSVQKQYGETSPVILQEGGELRDNPLSELPDDIWKDFQQSFLNTED